MTRITAVITAMTITAVLTASTYADAGAGVKRYLLSAGANNGGKDRVMLRYAVSDAKAFASVLMEMGGVGQNNALILSNPNSRELLAGVDNLGKLIALEREPGARSEVFVYYSGHADENGLKLGGETLPWAEFRNAVNSLNADVRVAVLDACGSGAITRTKGGFSRAAFLSDASSNMKGYAFLTSSNENESSQESDRIRGSYFTYALLGGMRGAADMTGDGKVTINEAYQYAFNETLQSTQNTRAGTQHPSRDMNLAGTGDVVMTDLRETGAALSLDANIDGRFFIRDGQGNLFAELRKAPGRAIELGMPPGRYSVQMETPSKTWLSSEIEIAEGNRAALTMNDMKPMKTKSAVSRGDGAEEGVDYGYDAGGADDAGYADAADSIGAEAPAGGGGNTGNDSLPAQPVETVSPPDAVEAAADSPPAVSSAGPSAAKTAVSNPLLDSACRMPYRLNTAVVVARRSAPASGIQLSLLVNAANAEFCGTQLSFAANMALMDMNGAQLSAALNISAGRLSGIQAGAVNVAGGDIDGIQAGVLNAAAGNISLIQAGCVNMSLGGAGLIQGGAVNFAKNVGVIQGGSVNFADSVGVVQGGSVNFAGNVGYVQGGAVNFAGNVGYVQGGSVNFAGNVGYVQGGAVNIAGNVGYFQAGTVNIAGAVEQVQAGAVNVAGRVKRQIGVVNIAGYSERTPVGLINIIGNGIIDATAYADACGDFGVSLHTGTPWLYTAFEYQQPFGGWDGWPKSWGWGVGTRFGMNGPLYLNMDATWIRAFYNIKGDWVDVPPPPPDTSGGNVVQGSQTTAVRKLDHIEDSFLMIDGLARVRFGVNYRLLPFLAVTAGASVNAQFDDLYDGKVRDKEGSKDGTKERLDQEFSAGTMWSDYRIGRHGQKMRLWPSFYAGLTIGKSGPSKPPKP